MALGSSAPEILLSVIETVQGLGGQLGELGPSTIVGSAAFNLMVISAVSIMAVGPEHAKNIDDSTGLQDPSMPAPGIKKINDVGVFAITAIASVFAYIWMYIVLGVQSKDEVEMWEAFLTLGFFLILVVAAFLVDRHNSRKRVLKEHNVPPYSFATIMKVLQLMSNPVEEKKLTGEHAKRYPT